MTEIVINDDLKLIKFNKDYHKLLYLYQDINNIKLISNTNNIYSLEDLIMNYNYYNEYGYLYFISFKGIIIGDVFFNEIDLNIIVDEKFRKLGIGGLVIDKIIELAKNLKFKSLRISSVFNFNIASIRLFESKGFEIENINENERSYILYL